MAVQNNATVQMVRDLISGDINLPLYAAKGGKLVPVYYDGTSWTAISGYTAQVNVGDVALVLALASSTNWGTNQLGDLRVITAVSTSLTLSETLLGNIFGAGGRYRIKDFVFSGNETSPAEDYGGSWERITDRFLVGAGGSYTLGSTGGSADAVVVEHTHDFSYDMVTWGVYSGGENANLSNGDPYICQRNATLSIGTAGESGTGKNMPPYLAVNIWRRVA